MPETNQERTKNTTQKSTRTQNPSHEKQKQKILPNVEDKEFQEKGVPKNYSFAAAFMAASIMNFLFFLAEHKIKRRER